MILLLTIIYSKTGEKETEFNKGKRFNSFLIMVLFTGNYGFKVK